MLELNSGSDTQPQITFQMKANIIEHTLSSETSTVALSIFPCRPSINILMIGKKINMIEKSFSKQKYPPSSFRECVMKCYKWRITRERYKWPPIQGESTLLSRLYSTLIKKLNTPMDFCQLWIWPLLINKHLLLEEREAEKECHSCGLILKLVSNDGVW